MSLPLRPLLGTLCLMLALSACAPAAEESEPAPVALTATPVPRETPEETPEPTPEPTPTPEEEQEEDEEAERDPTEADSARFAAGYRPRGASNLIDVIADLDGSGWREIVFAYVLDAEETTRVDVAAWTGTRYEIMTRVAGGPADRIDRLRIADVTGDGTLEVILTQRRGGSGHSASVWQARAGGLLEPLRAVGDCFDGSHTYGDTGVRLSDRTGDDRLEISAVCRDPDLPEAQWPTVVYAWEDGAYRCAWREADGETTECE